MTRMDWGQSFYQQSFINWSCFRCQHRYFHKTDGEMEARYLTIKSGFQLLWWLFAVKAAEKLSIFLYHLYWILIQTYHSSRDVVSFSKLHCSMNKLFFQFSFFWPGKLFHMSSSHNIFLALNCRMWARARAVARYVELLNVILRFCVALSQH